MTFGFTLPFSIRGKWLPELSQFLRDQHGLHLVSEADKRVLDACGALDEGLLLVIAQRYPELIPLLEAVTAKADLAKRAEKPDGG